MWTEFLYTLRRYRGRMIGWSIGLILYGLLLGSMYDSFAEMEGIAELLQSYPKEMLAFFDGILEMTSPAGYLNVEYFTLINIIVGIFVISIGAKLIVGDEENGLLDLVLSYPVSRRGFFWGRLVALIVMIAVILVIAWLSLTLPSEAFGFDLTAMEIARPFISLFALLMFFSTLAFLVSLVLPSSRMAGMFSGALLIANFLFLGLANINEDLEKYVEFTPLHYYQGGDAINQLNWEWIAILLLTSMLFILLAFIFFSRRDVRVSGEHSWALPKVKFLQSIKNSARSTNKTQ